MSAKANQATEAQTTTDYTPGYGDTFRHIITHDEKTVHTCQDGKVTWVNGGWDPVEEVESAVSENEMSMYEPVAVGDDVYEGDGY